MIKRFNDFINEAKLDTVQLKVPAGWSIQDSWESNSGNEMQYILIDDTKTFTITIEWQNFDESYSIGFGEVGEKYIVDTVDRYQVNSLKGTKTNKAILEMANFLKKYINK